MDKKILITLNTAAQILMVEPYRVIHLCEKGCVRPSEDSQGQGTVRRFSRDDLFRLAVCLELQNAGATSARIEKAMILFDSISNTTGLTAVFAEKGLCGVIEKLGSSENPSLLHVKMTYRGIAELETLPTMLQTSFGLPKKSQVNFCPDSRDVDAWPVRITVNLTHCLSTIQLR